MELNNLILPITLVVFGIFFYKYFSLMLEKFNWTQIGKLTSDAYNKIDYFYKK